jgi:4-diphosphocytidyl-2-C-methyl-D-erythritol kinase
MSDPLDRGQASEAGKGLAALPARALAPAKINLGLFVGPTRADGRHELVSVMQSISLADELTLELAPADEPAPSVPPAVESASGVSPTDEVVCPGVSGPSSENLAARALAAFRTATGWDAPPLRLKIVKRIPIAAGLGGGSADAAAALRLAAHVSGLGDQALLRRLGAELGADVPAQIAPGRWLAGGAGEVLEQLPPPNPSFAVLVLPVAAALSTAEVYARADRLGALRTHRFLTERHHELQGALGFGAQAPPPELLANDLEAAARKLAPGITVALGLASDGGADHVFLSGSGPTVIGLFLRANGPTRVQRALAGLEGREPEPSCAVPVDAEFGRAASVPVGNN